MKIICNKNDLIDALNIVTKAVPGRTTMSILQCLLIDSTNGDIRITANDMDMAIETIVPGMIKEKGIVAIESDIFNSIIRNLPDSEVNIICDDDYNVIVTCDKTKLSITGRSGEDFHALPLYERVNPIVLSQLTFKDIIRKTIFSVNINDTNKVMAGELFEIKGNNLKVASHDRHRISIRNVKLKESYENISVIVPGKCMNELGKIISGNDEDLEIYISDKTIVFEFNNTKVFSRLVEGKYFDIDSMIMKNHETKLSINRKNLLNCISRASIFIKEGDKKPIIVNIKDNNMEIRCNSTIGCLNESIDIVKEGNDQLIGFDHKFISDILRVLDDEEISFYLLNSKSPCFIRDEDDSYIYLVLPVNFVNVN